MTFCINLAERLGDRYPIAYDPTHSFQNVEAGTQFHPEGALTARAGPGTAGQ
jgi:hypothetical protein